jgi:hypothetical protein
MDTLPPEVSRHLFDLSLFILTYREGTYGGNASNEFDGLFPGFEYWDTRHEVTKNGLINYEAAKKLDVADTIRKIWLLGYPNIATTAERFIRNLGVPV